MALLSGNDSLAFHFDDSLYSIAKLSANKEVKSLAAKPRAARKNLTTLVAARIVASENTVLAEAAADFAFEEMEDKATVLEKKVIGVHAEKPEKVTVIFKQTVRHTFNSSITTRDGQLEAIAKALGKPGLAAELKTPSKGFLEARAEWLTALATYEAAQDVEAEAIEVLAEGKRLLVATMVATHGLLQAKYSTDRRKIETFFRKRVTAAARAAKNAKAKDPAKDAATKDAPTP